MLVLRVEKQLINNAYQSRKTDCEHTNSNSQVCLKQMKRSTKKAADQMYLLPMIKNVLLFEKPIKI